MWYLKSLVRGLILLLCMNGWAVAEYIKVANNGIALPKTAGLGGSANDWACTYDSTNQLIWEVKTNDKGLRHKDWTYSWYDSNSLEGQKGVVSGSSNCQQSGRCDTEKFVTDVNTGSLCGAKNWRLASLQELKGIVRCNGLALTNTQTSCLPNDKSPTVDNEFFPNTPSPAAWTWSSTAYEDDPKLAVWYVDFNIGGFSIADRLNNGLVRLVRSGRPYAANVASFDDKTGRLSLSAVQIGNQVFSAELQDMGGYQFQLLRYDLIQNDLSLILPAYSGADLVLTIPVLNAFSKQYLVQMQNHNGVFSIIRADLF